MTAMNPAVVVALDCITGLQTARILTARGIAVTGIAADRHHFCARTRAVTRVVESPTAGDALIATLERLGPKLGADRVPRSVLGHVGPDDLGGARATRPVVPVRAATARRRRAARRQDRVHRARPGERSGDPRDTRPAQPGRRGGRSGRARLPRRDQARGQDRRLAGRHEGEGLPGRDRGRTARDL